MHKMVEARFDKLKVDAVLKEHIHPEKQCHVRYNREDHNIEYITIRVLLPAVL